MIVASKKPLDEIIASLEGYEKILIAGCNECVTVCEAGGKKEVAELAALLRDRLREEGRSIQIDEVTLERQCDHPYLEEIRNVIDQYDAVLSTACGVGVQFLAEKYETTPVLPGVDTVFMGVMEAEGVFGERCQGCGQCVLASTGGICPVARCSKRMLNGPCGGSTGGHCEVNKDIDCGWQLIIDRLKSLNRLKDYERVTPIKDWSSERAGGPRKVIREDVRR